MRGLVLEGGGVRGAYQAGAYKAFKKCKIKFDCVVGTSIGSLNAAMIVANKTKKLEEVWLSKDVSTILGLDSEFSKIINDKKSNYKLFKGVSSIVLHGGINSSGMRDLLDELFSEEEIRKSKIDFGLVTLRLNSLKPVEIFKENIPDGKLKDYIIASCYLPIFKAEKIIDDSYYVDGGIFNNLPISMLEGRGFDEIYAVRLNSFSISKKVHNKSNVIYINPSRKLGSILALNKDIRKRNIDLGYYDTIKILKKLDGYDYIFKRKKEKFYKFITRKINTKEIKRVSDFFKTKNYKDTVIKAIEYILNKEKVDYLNIYKPYKMIRRIKKSYNNKHFIYEFVNKIKLL